MREHETPVRYQLFKPVRAVKLQDHPGSSLRTPTGTLLEIPVNAIVELEGGASTAGLSTILWNSDPFSVFYEDLKENGNILDGRRDG
jgi:hypothetical protein